MKSLLKKLETYLNALSRRDQISLGIILFVVIVAIWFRAIYVPLKENFEAVKNDLEKTNTDTIVVRAKMGALKKAMREDPDRENKNRLAKYVRDNRRLDIALAKTSTQIINPQEMVKLLEQMLKNQSGLKFISLKNRPATAEFLQAANTDTNVRNKAVRSMNTIYRHSVVLKVQGSYHNALAYMQKLEKLPWRFFWQSMEIDGKKYPNSVITLEVYTLGFREGLIGV